LPRRPRNGCLHVLCRRVNVAIQRELDGDCALPSALTDDIESTPAIMENCFSSGVATDDAMVSGFAPGRLAETWMVG